VALVAVWVALVVALVAVWALASGVFRDGPVLADRSGVAG